MATLNLTVRVRWWLRPLIAVLVVLVRCGMPGRWAMKLLGAIGTKALRIKVGNGR